ICGRHRTLFKEAPPPTGEILRGGADSAGAEETGREIALGDLLGAGGVDELNRAARRLEEATAGDPDDASGWSDLAAVYLVRAQKADDPRDLLRAYEAASRAVREDGSLPQARFNEALALERLYLTDPAIAAWQEYRKLDRSSGWAEEAGKRSELLRRRRAGGVWDEQERLLHQAALMGKTRRVEAIVGEYRQAAREYAEQRLCGAWADAAAARQDDLAAGELRVLKAIGNALVRTSGEHLVRDTVADIQAVAASGDSQRWQDLLQGMRDFRDGYKEYDARKTSGAAPKLEAADEALTRAGSPFALRAAFFLASNDYIARRYPRAIVLTGRLGRRIRGLPYGALRGHVYWIKALSETTMGRTQEAIEDYAISAAAFQRLGESENAANIDCRLGEVLVSRGRRQEAWQYIYHALRSSPQLRDAGQLATLFVIAGNAAIEDGMDEASLVFQQERVRQSRLSNPLATVEALTWLAHLQHQLGDRAGARASLREAERRVGELEESARPRRRADLAMTQGLMIAREDPARAAEL